MPQSVLVTGCSSGIGQATAERFAARGWNVAATARDPSRIEVRGANVLALALDVTDEAAIAGAIARARERFGAIDVLVNNAGYGVFGPLEGGTMDDVRGQFATNLLGAILLIRHVLPGMRERRAGTIVNVSSIGGRVAAPFASLYHASKFALEGLSESLQYELALHDVRVKLVEPAHFKTGFIARALRRVTHPAYERAFDHYMDGVRHEDVKAPAPDPVVDAIWRAATDGSPRLRYPVQGAMEGAMTRFLPASFWRSIYADSMKRSPKGVAEGDPRA